MMPVIRINDATFADLSTLKTWFGVASPGEIIDRLVGEAMERLDIVRDVEPEGVTKAIGDGTLQFDTAPGLAFTKPLTASINGKPLNNPKWATILLAVIAAVAAKGITGEKLARELPVPARAGQYEEEGYRYHPELGVSVQGQSASDCWKATDGLARKWRIPVKVTFRWRDNPKAQYPGKTGALRSGTV